MEANRIISWTSCKRTAIDLAALAEDGCTSRAVLGAKLSRNKRRKLLNRLQSLLSNTEQKVSFILFEEIRLGFGRGTYIEFDVTKVHRV